MDLEKRKKRGKMVSIVSFNAFNSIPEPFRYNGLSSRAQRFANAFYTSVGLDVDIICLQEFIWKRDAILKDFIHHPFVTPIMRSSIFTSNVRPIQSGLCILSKYPILQIWATVFNGPTYHVERLMAKGALCIRVGVPNIGVINVVNIHLNAWYGVQANTARQCQIQHIIKWIKQLHISPQEPIFIAGDLNVDGYEHGDEIQQMMDQLNASYYYPLQTQFSFDPAVNPLVGMDAPEEYATMSRKAGCAEEYLLNGTCSCCPRQLIDVICFLKDHRVPSEIKMEVVPILSPTPFSIQVQMGIQKTIQHISDHHAVVFRAHFSLLDVLNESYSILPMEPSKETVEIKYDTPRFEITTMLAQVFLTFLFLILLCLVGVWIGVF